jgi:hypothetical protein
MSKDSTISKHEMEKIDCGPISFTVACEVLNFCRQQQNFIYYFSTLRKTAANRIHINHFHVLQSVPLATDINMCNVYSIVLKLQCVKQNSSTIYTTVIQWKEQNFPCHLRRERVFKALL